MKNLTILITILTIIGFSFAQSVDIRDSDDNILIQINDEVTVGSITIPSPLAGLPSSRTDKLYASKGSLYWNDNKLGTAVSAGGWTDDGTVVRLVSITDNVGIGTATPGFKLDVVGTAQMTGFKLPTGAAVGKILTSDANGVGTWQTSPSGADNLGDHTAEQDINMAGFEVNLNGGYLSGDGDNEGVYVDSDGAVGIGTASPTHKLHVVGSETLDAVGYFENTITSSNGVGVYGVCNNTDDYGYGGSFQGGNVGAQGNVLATGVGSYTGFYGYAGKTANYGTGTNYGVRSFGEYANYNYGIWGAAYGTTGTTTNYGVYGKAVGIGTNYAGYFAGDVEVTGSVSKASGSFKIDHPLDPENKYLYHSFVESPDMMNIYNGNVVTNANGEAIVEMPEYFEPLNKEFRYQLTCIGGWAPLYIAEEISGNRFKIAGGEAGMKVSWQVTGIRQDAFANANRIEVEVDKPTHERGKYLHPEAIGRPHEMSVDYHPEEEAEMQRMEEQDRLHNERRAQEKKAYQEQKTNALSMN